jgi:hypothetical protein
MGDYGPRAFGGRTKVFQPEATLDATSRAGPAFLILLKTCLIQVNTPWRKVKTRNLSMIT